MFGVHKENYHNNTYVGIILIAVTWTVFCPDMYTREHICYNCYATPTLKPNNSSMASLYLYRYFAFDYGFLSNAFLLYRNFVLWV